MDEFKFKPKTLENFKILNQGEATEDQKELYQIIGRYMDLCLVSDRKDYLVRIALITFNINFNFSHFCVFILSIICKGPVMQLLLTIQGLKS